VGTPVRRDRETARSDGAAVTAGESADRRRRRRINLSVLVTAQALYLFITSIDLTLTGLVGYRIAPTTALATFPFALIAVAGTVSTAPAAFLMSRIGRRAGFMFGSIFPLLGGLISVHAISQHNFALFCLGTACVGIYQGFAVYYKYTAADDALPERRPHAISTVIGAGVAAAVAGPFVAAGSRDLLGVPFAGAYLLTSVLAGVSMLVLLLLRMPRAARATGGGDPNGEPARPLRRVCTQPAFVTGVAAAAIGYFVMMLLMTAAPLAGQAHHHSIEQGAMVVQWHLVGMFAPSLVSGRVVQRLGAPRAQLGGVILCMLCSVVALLGSSQPNFLVALAAVGVGWNFMQVAGTTLVVQSYRPAEQARAQAVAESCTAVGATAGSLSSGVLLTLVGWNGLNVVALGVLALPAVLTAGYLVSAGRGRAPVRPAAAAAEPSQTGTRPMTTERPGPKVEETR
jgi:MFS family permease